MNSYDERVQEFLGRAALRVADLGRTVATKHFDRDPYSSITDEMVALLDGIEALSFQSDLSGEEKLTIIYHLNQLGGLSNAEALASLMLPPVVISNDGDRLISFFLLGDTYYITTTRGSFSAPANAGTPSYNPNTRIISGGTFMRDPDSPGDDFAYVLNPTDWEINDVPFSLDSSDTLAFLVAPASSGKVRIDRVILKNDGTFAIVQGEESTSSAFAPPTPANAISIDQPILVTDATSTPGGEGIPIKVKNALNGEITDVSDFLAAIANQVAINGNTRDENLLKILSYFRDYAGQSWELYEDPDTGETKIQLVLDGIIGGGGVGRPPERFEATDGQTVFTLSEDPGDVQILVTDGVVVVDPTLYSRTGSTITFTTGRVADAVIVVYFLGGSAEAGGPSGPITLEGDVTGTGTSTIPTTLATTGVTPGSYSKANLQVDSKGRVISAANGGIDVATLSMVGTTVLNLTSVANADIILLNDVGADKVITAISGGTINKEYTILPDAFKLTFPNLSSIRTNAGTAAAINGYFGDYIKIQKRADNKYYEISRGNYANPQGLPTLSSGLLAKVGHWYKPDDLVLSDGALVSSWPNAGPSGGTATASGTARPTYKAAGINGHPAVLWNGSTTAMDLANYSIAQVVTVIDNQSGGTFPDEQGYFGSPVVASPNLATSGQSGTTNMYLLPPLVSTRIDGIVKNDFAPLNAPKIVSAKYSGSFTDANGWQMGSDRKFSGRWWNGYMGDQIGFTSPLSQNEEAEIMNYLTIKYGLSRRGTLLVGSGNSIPAGYLVGPTNSYLFQARATLGNMWELNNVSVSATNTDYWLTNAASVVDVLYNAAARNNINVFHEASNSLKDGLSASAVYTKVMTYTTGRVAAGFKVLLPTVISRDPADAGAGFEAQRQAYNAMLRAFAETDTIKVLDISDPLLDAPTAYISMTYFVDGVHPTTSGHAIISSVLTPKLVLF